MTNRIERELLLEVPVPEVWEAVTAGEWLADEVILDLRPGGDATFRWSEQTKTGWIEEVCRPNGDGAAGRLAFWWAQDGEPATRVELTVAPDGDRAARIRVVETCPLDVLDLVGIPLPGIGGPSFGPALMAVR
ncbi:MAG: hypothetical protein M3Z06_00325 [Actinomycetota bacterium]|nr:hypothetical protein [Actinomycetota bacterium]